MFQRRGDWEWRRQDDLVVINCGNPRVVFCSCLMIDALRLHSCGDVAKFVGRLLQIWAYLLYRVCGMGLKYLV